MSSGTRNSAVSGQAPRLFALTILAIYFYSTKGEYGEFSNFSRHPFKLDGLLWPTAEQFFQAQKFEDAKYRETIRLAHSASIAARLGRSRSVPIRPDWEEVKDEVMLRGIPAKFHAHATVKELLLSTGHEEIVEKTTGDAYWGCGSDGDGKNRLGIILMRVRDELRR